MYAAIFIVSIVYEIDSEKDEFSDSTSSNDVCEGNSTSMQKSGT